MIMNSEEKRLEESSQRKVHWKRWGPYLSERQWGTVREDYSPSGTPSDFFPHNHARPRTYLWASAGIAFLTLSLRMQRRARKTFSSGSVQLTEVQPKRTCRFFRPFGFATHGRGVAMTIARVCARFRNSTFPRNTAFPDRE